MSKSPSAFVVSLSTIIMLGGSLAASAEENPAQLVFVQASETRLEPERLVEKNGIGPAVVFDAVDQG
jgi:hypothetical protein